MGGSQSICKLTGPTLNLAPRLEGLHTAQRTAARVAAHHRGQPQPEGPAPEVLHGAVPHGRVVSRLDEDVQGDAESSPAAGGLQNVDQAGSAAAGPSAAETAAQRAASALLGALLWRWLRAAHEAAALAEEQGEELHEAERQERQRQRPERKQEAAVVLAVEIRERGA